ncbi:MAG TPA: CHRD domain-containing protein [Firmicutes bacterium]|jgi:hypothetical protein|nr:CHRD domain-containing protein [Bacillota bacterium]
MAAERFITEPRFTADLAGEFEVPFVDTPGRGEASFRQVGNNRLTFTLSTRGLRDITQAHIHKGRKGRNGPIVAWLFGPSTGTSRSGVLASGTLQRRDLVGPLQGRSIQTLVRLLRAGDAYVNVHTRRYPEGEIRGQIRRAGQTAISFSGDWWRYGGTSLM